MEIEKIQEELGKVVRAYLPQSPWLHNGALIIRNIFEEVNPGSPLRIEKDEEGFVVGNNGTLYKIRAKGHEEELENLMMALWDIAQKDGGISLGDNPYRPNQIKLEKLREQEIFDPKFVRNYIADLGF